jgi:hypothetical protein
MKKLLLLNLGIIIFFNASTQNVEIRKAEESFINLLGQKLFSKLNNTTLSDIPYKKLYYYSYQVFDDDSIIWFSYNNEEKLIDSFAKNVFLETIDSIKKNGTLSLLRNNAKTYIPLYIFYKTHYKEPFDDKVSITPTEIVFGWGKDENMEPQAIYRISKPFIFKLPKSKPYF